MSTIEERVRDLESATQVLQATRVSWYARLDALEERVEEMDRCARDTDRRVDVLDGRVNLLNLERMMDAPVHEKSMFHSGDWKIEAPVICEPLTYRAEPKPSTEPGELVKLVRDRSHDPMFRALYGQGELSGPDWMGTNHYARLAILAVIEHLEGEDYFFLPAAKHLRAQLEP